MIAVKEKILLFEDLMILMNQGANKQRYPELFNPIRLEDGLSHEAGCVTQR